MADDLKPLAPRVRQLVIEEAISFLGMCAGAIAATHNPMLICDSPIAENQPQEMVEAPFLMGKMHLKLYSGNCCYFQVPGCSFYGTQKIKMVSSEENQKTYDIYFQKGVFFPNARKEPDATPLLEYTSYKSSGFHTQQKGPKQIYDNIVPIAAVTQKVGKGRLLLSGVHPEIGPSVVQTFSTSDNPIQEKAKTNTINSQYDSKAAQDDTRREYLNTLCIATKKV